MLPKLKKMTSFKFDKPCHNAQERGPPRSEKERTFFFPASEMSGISFQ
jgi:hypothetical protein